MKKNVLFNSKTVLYTLLLFFVNVLFLPDAYLIFDTFNFDIRENHIGLCVLIALTLLVLSAVSAVIIQKLFSAKDEFLAICGMLLLADTLFKSTVLNFIHLALLTVSIILSLYLSQGKKFWLKTVLTSVFVVVLPVLSPESIFCQVPFVLIAYSFALAKEKEAAPALKNKKGNKQKAKNTIKETVLMAGLTALGIILGFSLKDSVSDVVLAIGYSNNASAYFLNGSFCIGFIPYVILLVAFVWGYFVAKSKEQKKSVGKVIAQSDFWWITLLSFGFVLYGIIVERLSSSITVLNALSVATVVLLYSEGTKSSQKSAEGILAFFRKYKYVVLSVVIVWFFVTQFVLKNMQFSLLDRMLSMVGGTL